MLSEKMNYVAHNLVRQVKHVSGLVVWREEVPPPIVSVLLADSGWVFLLMEFSFLLQKKKRVLYKFKLDGK